MLQLENLDIQLFVDIDIKSLSTIRCDFEQKESYNKGRRNSLETYRLFLTSEQFNKYVQRIENRLTSGLTK